LTFCFRGLDGYLIALYGPIVYTLLHWYISTQYSEWGSWRLDRTIQLW